MMTTEAVYDFFAEKRKEEKQQLREEKLEEQRAAASKLYVISKATSDAKTITKLPKAKGHSFPFAHITR